MGDRTNEFPKLDELDRMLLRDLEKDARLSYQVLASRSGVSATTVQRRMQRLFDAGVTRIAVISDYAYLGYETRLALAINVPQGMVHEVADRLAGVDRVKHIWLTSGPYDILALAFYRNISEFLEQFPEELGDLPVNVGIETILMVKTVKGSWTYLTHDSMDAVSPRRSLSDDGPTELDLSLIRELERDPRGAIKDFSNRLGVSVVTVRHRLRKLTQQGIIRITCVAGRQALEHNVRGATFIQCHPGSLNIVANKLKAYPQVRQITLTMGAFNCMIYTLYKDSNDMRDFLLGAVGEMSGIVRFENMVGLDIRKSTMTLVSDPRSQFS